MNPPAPIEEPQNERPPRRRWLLRLIAYLRDPKVLLGGLLVFVVTQGIDFAKTQWKYNREELQAAQKDVSELVRNLPETSNGIGDVMRAVETLFVTYREASTHEYLAAVVGHLGRLRAAANDAEVRTAAAQRAKEAEERAVQESRKAEQAARDAVEAEKARLEREAQAKAAAEAAAKLEAERKEAQRQAADRRAEEERRAVLSIWREMRIPK